MWHGGQMLCLRGVGPRIHVASVNLQQDIVEQLHVLQGGECSPWRRISCMLQTEYSELEIRVPSLGLAELVSPTEELVHAM